MSDVVYKSAEGAASVAALYKDVLAHWPVEKTGHHIETREGATFVLTCGPQNAPPVLLLHGSQANSAAWLPDVALWAQRFRLYAVDMIGEAGFSARVRPPLEGETHALWLDDVLEGLGLDHAALVGTSLGGWLALDYAARRPGRVDALALVCPAGIGRQKNFLAKALPLALLGSWGRYKMREMVFGPVPDPLPPDLERISPLMEAIGKAIRPRPAAVPQLTDAQLAALGMPILAIVGGRDALLDSAHTRERLRRNAPHAEIAFMDEGYHFLPGLASPIMAFLERSTGL